MATPTPRSISRSVPRALSSSPLAEHLRANEPGGEKGRSEAGSLPVAAFPCRCVQNRLGELGPDMLVNGPLDPSGRFNPTVRKGAGSTSPLGNGEVAKPRSYEALIRLSNI